IFQHDQFVITADFRKRALQIAARIVFIADEQLSIRTRNARWCVDQSLAIGIVPGPFDERSNGRLGVGLGWFRHSNLSRIARRNLESLAAADCLSPYLHM